MTDTKKVDWSGLDFDTIVEESGEPISFENVGDVFIGEYIGAELIDPTGKSEDTFTVHKFRADDGSVKKINGGFKLNQGMEAVESGKIVRITRTADVPMADPGKNPMKDYRVDVAK